MAHGRDPYFDGWPDTLQLDYAYDKRLYDRLREGPARPVREHFHAGLDYQDRLARFLENHDEPRGPGSRERRAMPTLAGPTTMIGEFRR